MNHFCVASHGIHGINQAKIVVKLVILFLLLNMTIWCKHIHRLELQNFFNFCVPHLPDSLDIKTKFPYFLFWTCTSEIRIHAFYIRKLKKKSPIFFMISAWLRRFQYVLIFLTACIDCWCMWLMTLQELSTQLQSLLICFIGLLNHWEYNAWPWSAELICKKKHRNQRFFNLISS